MRNPGVIGVLCMGLAACGGKDAEQAAAPLPPALGVLELPISLRAADAAPSDFHKVEVNLTEVRANDQIVIKLENGRVPAAEKQDGVITKLKAALQSPAHPRITLAAHASLPYETAAMVLNSAAAAGIHQLSFQVRKAGAATDTGWLTINGFQMTPRTYDEVPISNVDPRNWDDFANLWQQMHDECRGSQTASCPYVPEAAAKGGKLKIVLFAAGSGVNLNFERVGLSPEQLAAEDKERKSKLADHKEDVIQGRMKQTDLEKELTEGDPASNASFQFRGREAVTPPSTITQVMQPLCGTRACGAVVSAESPTMNALVVQLIGAAFADGSAAPSLAFEMPWTEKPKPPPELAPEPAPEAAAAPAKKSAPAKKKKK
jgi:biopolymer transport protein ExbD